MKRCAALTFLIITLVLLFASCNNSEYIQKDFSSDISVETGNEQYRGNFSFNSKGTLCFTLSFPEALAGAKINADKNSKLLSYSGITIPLCDEAVLGNVADIILDFSLKTHSIKKSGLKKIKGSVNNREYTVVLDCEKQKITEIYFGECICKLM